MSKFVVEQGTNDSLRFHLKDLFRSQILMLMPNERMLQLFLHVDSTDIVRVNISK